MQYSRLTHKQQQSYNKVHFFWWSYIQKIKITHNPETKPKPFTNFTINGKNEQAKIKMQRMQKKTQYRDIMYCMHVCLQKSNGMKMGKNKQFALENGLRVELIVQFTNCFMCKFSMDVILKKNYYIKWKSAHKSLQKKKKREIQTKQTEIDDAFFIGEMKNVKKNMEGSVYCVEPIQSDNC